MRVSDALVTDLRRPSLPMTGTALRDGAAWVFAAEVRGHGLAQARDTALHNAAILERLPAALATVEKLQPSDMVKSEQMNEVIVARLA